MLMSAELDLKGPYRCLRLCLPLPTRLFLPFLRSMPSFHPGVCLARSCCRFEDLLGVVSVVRPSFFFCTGSTSGTRRVSHWATAIHTFLPSCTDLMADRRQLAIITDQSTLRPLNVIMMKPSLFFGTVGGQGYTKPYYHKTQAISQNRRSSPPYWRWSTPRRTLLGFHWRGFR